MLELELEFAPVELDEGDPVQSVSYKLARAMWSAAHGT